jgi:DNA-binding CsgD family transcriptional regulator
MTSVLYSDQKILRRHRRLTIIFLAVVALLTLVDIIEDSFEGAEPLHILTEVCIIVSAGCAAHLIWKSSLGALAQSNSSLRQELIKTGAALEEFRHKNDQLIADFVTSVERQLAVWGLTPAESEVTLLLLKGLSLKEIATLRSTSERTVRQQAASVYEKSKLDGRAQLAAYFIESLLDDRK